jgi:AcrR family transcriptional regulator
MVASLSELEALDGVIPARQLRSREAQQRLLQAGEAVFARMGYDGAHVSDIAAAANVSIGSFYRRFRDKEALFHALQVEFVNRALFNIDRFFDMPKWREAAPGDLVYTLVRNTARAIERRAGFFRALFQRSLAGVPNSELDTLRQTDEHAGRRLAEFLRSVGASDRRDLEEACVFAIKALEGVIIQRILLSQRERPKLSTPETIDSLTALLWGYLRLDPKSLPQSR